ncbi:MAG: acyl CoA:acetate/3-ketoacid CoA transferase [Chitinophagales bacterium]
MGAKFITARAIPGLIKDGATVATVGMTMVSASEVTLKAIETSFLETGHPRDLTIVHSAGQSNRDRGLQHLAHEGLVKRIIGSHWGLQPKWMELIHTDRVEAYCLPQGQIAHLYRAMAYGNPGKLSKIGLGTFIDPRVEGGKMNARTRLLPDITEVVEFRGEEYLFYKEIPLDVVVIRGTKADEKGNLTTEEEAMKLELLPAVLAAKRFGGIVIAQVKHKVKHGTLHPKQVVVPGVFIDYVVVAENPEEDHRQTNCAYFDPAFCGDIRVPLDSLPPLPLSVRKVIGRRAVALIKPGSIINLGTGIPNDVVGPIAAEEGLTEGFTITVESGVYGGVPWGGLDFGIAKNMDALIEHHVQFDYYNGAGVDFTFMGAAEMDRAGNVNATKFGSRVAGAGGFIDITQGARCVVFCGTFTADGLEVDFVDGRPVIRTEGRVKKLVEKVQQISFSAEYAKKKGQKVFFVTERAVFELGPDGPVLIEVAPGIDMERDILAQMEFRPLISPTLKVMDERLFRPEPVGITLESW